jgi:divalent metal cation (Fe/Co/Zn/Cd) transporter
VSHPQDATTVELPVAARHKPGFWRGLSGALAAGVIVLTVVVFGLEVTSWSRGLPGLGIWVLIGHIVGAVLAVVVQRQVDRRTGRPALLAGLGQLAVVLAVLVLFWWT